MAHSGDGELDLVIVRVASGIVSLLEPQRFDRFHVDAEGESDERLASALGAAKAGELAGDAEAHIRVAFLEDAAGALAADPAWRDQFNAMLDYAAAKGWLTADREAIAAHVEGSRQGG